MALVNCEICGSRTPGGRLCSVRCIEEHVRLTAAANGAQFRCRVCGFSLSSQRRPVDPRFAGLGICSARCRDSELLYGRPAPATQPQSPEEWVRELDRRLMQDPAAGLGAAALGVLREVMASAQPVLPPQVLPVAQAQSSEREFILNPEGAKSDDSTTRRFAQLEIDEE